MPHHIYMVKAKDFSLPGAILIVISQLFSSFQSSESISKEIEKFRSEFQQSLVDRETFFVRKTELSRISNKIDKISSELVRMNEQIKNLKAEYISLLEEVEGDDPYDDQVIACSYPKGVI